ncbi:MAG: ATPase, T2SS/T4P/T4SS family [Candidatus Alcyoniella australis]|nr:ATPase, T2SS/T4P/T4SS family [Candidatus Alcyoniella australis]
MSQNDSKKRTALGTILYESKIIKNKDIERALTEQRECGCLFGEALLKLGLVTQEDVGWGLANQMNLPFIRLTSAQVDPAAVATVPEALARKHNALPFLLLEDELTLIVADPTDRLVVEEIGETTGRRINIGIGLEDEIKRLLDQVYGTAGVHNGFDVSSELWSPEELDELLRDGSGRAFLASLLVKAEQANATSVHLVPELQGTRVRFRINGQVQDVAKLSVAWATVSIARMRSLAGLHNGDRFAEGRLELDSVDINLHFHLNLLSTPHGMAATLINLSPGRFPKQISEFDLPRAEARQLKVLSQSRRGLLLVTGPDTLDKYRLLNLLARTRVRDNEMALAVGRFPLTPPEQFLLIGPEQDEERSIESTLRAVLDQGPDLLLIDNLSDQDSLQICLHAALSGRTLLSSLCFPDAASCLEYLSEVAESNVLLGTALTGIVSIANVGTADPEHDKPVSEAAAKRLLGLDSLPKGAKVLKRSRARPSSASGRIVLEVLQIDKPLADALKVGISGRELTTMLEQLKHEGLRDKVRALVLAGEAPIDEFEVLSVI